MIYATETVTSTSSKHFNNLLEEAVQKWQKQELDVDAQFALTAAPYGREAHIEPRYAALLIVRRKP